ncbi:MAG: hypothetical protein WAZ21_05130 [Candidatus Saccharimonadales bacterium]
MDENLQSKRAVPEIAPSILTSGMQESFSEIGYINSIMNSDDHLYGNTVKEIAQSLHTQVYLERDFIDIEDINDAGLFIDEYSDRSTYLLSENDNRRSACRYIRADKKNGIMSLPTAQRFSVDPEIIKQAAGVHRLSDLRHSEVIEVSGLASIRLSDDSERGAGRAGELDATRLLYASIIRRSLDDGHKLWLLNIDRALLRSLEMLIGKDQVHTLGEAVEYMGPATIPVAINPQDVVRAAFADKSSFGDMKQQYLLETLPGVSDRYLADDVKQMLSENGIPYESESRLRRLFRNRRALAYAAIIGYSSARALPVGAVEEFEGSAPLLWAIDIGTAVPYTWGLLEAVSAKTPLRRAVGATVASGSFVAPYAYFWSEGNDYPPHVNIAVGGLIGAATLLEAGKVRKDRKIAKALGTHDTLE